MADFVVMSTKAVLVWVSSMLKNLGSRFVTTHSFAMLLSVQYNKAGMGMSFVMNT